MSELEDLTVGDDVTCQWRPGQQGKVVETERVYGETLYSVTWPALHVGGEPETYTYHRKDLKKPWQEGEDVW